MVQLNSAIANKLDGLSNGVLNGHYIFNQYDSETYLEKRFSRADKYAHNIKFGAFNDAKLVEQYYNIREKAYREVLNEPEFDGSEDYFDKVSYKYLAVNGTSCVGGLRVTLAQPGIPVMMPMENEWFSIRDYFPEINFDALTYCECSRLGLLPEYRDGNLWSDFQMSVMKFMMNDLKADVIFGRSAAVQTRNFRTHFSKLGLELVVRKDIKVPHSKSNQHLNMQFWAVDYTKSKKYHDILAGKNASQPKFNADEVVFA